MIQIKSINKAKWLFGVALVIAVAGCKKETSPDAKVDPPALPDKSKHFIAANVGEATYLLTADDLESGSITTTGNGIELPRNYPFWVMNGKKVAVGLIYAKGDPGIGISYGLDKNGKLAPVGKEFQITSRFTSYGSFDKYVITNVSGLTLASKKLGASFSFIDLTNNNSLTEKTIVTENFTGNGDMATFSGIVDLDNGEFLTGVVCSGIKDAGAGGGSSTGVVHYPDSVWVAAIDKDLKVKRIYRDNRLSYSSGRYRSAYYSQIDKDDHGNVYVFSGAYEANTKKPAGALLIKKGAGNFDADFYFNIQEKSGGYRFRKVWHISEDYFLLEFYNDLNYTTNTPASQYGIVKMSDKSFKWLTTGFPAKDKITATGTPFTENGKMYLPVVAVNASPTIYTIDPKSGTAKAGLVVKAEGVAAISTMTY